jgi:pyruvate, orthophosphate dikinase
MHEFPLLLSIRQSPVQGSPGMATVLNLGINSNVMEQMRQVTGRNLFVLDTYRRFLQDWGTHVLNIPNQRYQSIIDLKIKNLGVRSAHSVSNFCLCRLL